MSDDASGTSSPTELGTITNAVFNALSSHICVIDRDGAIIAVNRAWRDFGKNNGRAIMSRDVGTNYLDICCKSSGPGGDEAKGFSSGVRSVLDGRAPSFQLEYPCHSPREWRWFLGRVTPLGTEQGGAVVSHMNITERKLLEFELTKLASTDPLTDLPNRRYFQEAAEREMERVRRFGTPASVVMIDLDRFKAVNDTHGHAAGDTALCSAAKSWIKVIRKVDILARLGGDEFICLLSGTDADAATRVAGRLRRAVSKTRINLETRSINITATFGVAQIWAGDQSISEALGRADSALHDAKRAGRDCVKTFAAKEETS
jgi:diguanylate cyclase (GGDEF)-like protein